MNKINCAFSDCRTQTDKYFKIDDDETLKEFYVCADCFFNIFPNEKLKGGNDKRKMTNDRLKLLNSIEDTKQEINRLQEFSVLTQDSKIDSNIKRKVMTEVEKEITWLEQIKQEEIEALDFIENRDLK